MSFNIPRPSSRASVTLGALVLVAALAALLLAAAGSASARSGGIGVNPDARNGSSATPAKYHRLWDRVNRKNRRWARRVAKCESGKDPKAVALNGRYRGAFMFTRDAWKTSPKTPGGDPIDYSYKTQAVVAVHLKKRDGTRPWPVCG